MPMIVELGSVFAVAAFGCAAVWLIRRKRDVTRAALRETLKQLRENKGDRH